MGWGYQIDTFRPCSLGGVFEHPLPHFGTLLISFGFHLDCCCYLFGSTFASKILPFSTRGCKAPAEQPQNNLHINLASTKMQKI